MDSGSESPPPYEALVRALPAFFAHITSDGRLLFLNRLAPGFTLEQVRGSTIFDYSAPAYHAAMRACLEQVARTGQPSGYSSVAQGAHGQLVPYYTLIAPFETTGEIRSLVLLATDVSEVAGAQRALEASEARLRVVLEATGMGTWTFERQRGDVTWDATLARQLGYASEPRTIPLAHSNDHVHPDDREIMRGAGHQMLATGSFGPLEHRFVRADGEVRWAMATGRVQHRDDHGPITMVGGAIDITERKLTEERLAQADKLDSIGRLAGGVAHDFNNMLTAILGYADLCLARSAPDGPVARDLREIQRAAERSRELTSRLLAFARKHPVEQRVFDPNAVIRELERLLSRIVGEDIAMTTSLRTSHNVRMDPHQLEQLLVNLVTNARDAMPSGGAVSIETTDLELVRAERELPAGSYVRIVVRDTGVGIAPAVLEHVFEPFFTTKEAGKGTGLGLAQCYGIARQAGGSIRIESKPGAGTSVLLDVPASADHMSARSSAHRVEGRGDEAVLLVEDESQIRALVGRQLRDHGYRVLEARNGDEALALAAAHHAEIDLLVTDMVMPGMNGLELARRLTALRPALHVLVMSGYADQFATERPPYRVLAKPFRSDELLVMIREVLGGA